MIGLKITLILLGVFAVCYAFFGTMFVAHSGAPINSKYLKRYKFVSYVGILTLFLGGFVIIFL